MLTILIFKSLLPKIQHLIGVNAISSFGCISSQGSCIKFVLSAAALITCLISALFPQGLKVAGQAGFPTKDGFARISTEVSHVLPLHVRSNTAAIDQTVVNSMAPTLAMTPALKELMTLRVAENTSKAFVDKLKPVTPINVNLLESLLTDHPYREFVVNLCSSLRDRFKIG